MIKFFMWAILTSLHITTYAGKFFAIKQTDKRFTFYPECFYKNSKKEISPAEECLKINDKFLIVPKGSLRVCYIDSHNVENNKKGYIDRAKKAFGGKKSVFSSSFSFKQKNDFDKICSTLNKQIHYDYVIYLYGYIIKWSSVVKDKNSLKKFSKAFLKECPSKFLLYYDKKSKRKKIFDIENRNFIKLEKHFRKCE